MKIIGVDLDGTLTIDNLGIGGKILSFFPPWFWVLLPRWGWYILWSIRKIEPRKKMIEHLECLRRREGNSIIIIIITARPPHPCLIALTETWLKRNNIPFDLVFFVGPHKGVEQRKLEVIIKQKIDLYIDDQQQTIKFLLKNNIAAYTPTYFLEEIEKRGS